MVSGINQWYKEKEDWVNQAEGKVTGHYTSMINPSYTYVGLGDFYTEEASFSNTLAGEFSFSTEDLDQTMQDAPSDVMQKIEVKNSYITGYTLEGVSAIYTDKTTMLTPKANLANDSKSHKLWVLDALTYTSSDTSVATVTDDGVVTGHKNGETVITAQSDSGVLASTTITIKCGHTKELLSSTPPTCKEEGLNIYRCDICGEAIEQKLPKTIHMYIYGNADSAGYRTGICSFCHDTLKIIPPMQYNLWWRNSTSDSDKYTSLLFPSKNPINSTVYCRIENIDGDENYRDMIIESSDESVISVPETALPNFADNELHVLAPGITTLTIYPKYNPGYKNIYTVRIGDPQSVDISTADTVLSQTSYPYTGKACTPDVSVSFHDTPLKADKDYTLTYENNIEAGTATAVITGAGIFRGTIRKDFTITEAYTPEPALKAISACTITVDPDSFVYDGTAKTPNVTVKYGNTILAKDTDFTVSYQNNINVGAATAVIAGKGSYTGTVSKNFTITQPSTPVPESKELSKCVITLSQASYTYDGTVKTPVITVKDGNKTLVNHSDYTLIYKNNINAGTAEVTIIGKGLYKGEVTKYFTIKIKKGTSHKIGSYQYKVTGVNTVSMTKILKRNVKKVQVPKTVKIGGKQFKVTAIANKAFKNNKQITNVQIQDNVKAIGASAFEGCTKLTKATLGKSVTQIGGNAFKGCKKLNTLTIKSTKLKKVGKNALKGIHTTAKIKVPSKKLSAYKKLFKNKGQGKKVKILK